MADYTYLLTRKSKKGPPAGKSQLVTAASPQAAMATAAEELFEIQRVEGTAAKLLAEQLGVTPAGDGGEDGGEQAGEPGEEGQQAGEGSGGTE